MGTEPLYEELAGQRLTSIFMHEPWGAELPSGHEQARWSLLGAIALVFERHTLIATSPLRYLRSTQGTQIGLAGGRSISLGFRAMVCEAEHAEALVDLRLGLPPTDSWWGWWSKPLPVIGKVLAASPWLCPPATEAQPAALVLDFESGLRYRLDYRLELDGCIEFAREGVRCEPTRIEVGSANGPLGWLHARRIAGFVLDDQLWRNTEEWPIDVLRQLRRADDRELCYRLMLKRAWLAYFRQHPRMRRRLLALSMPVQAKDLPDGLIDEVRAELLAEVGTGEAGAIGLCAGSCARAVPAPARPP